VKLLVNVGLDDACVAASSSSTSSNVSSTTTIDTSADFNGAASSIPKDVDAVLLCDATLESLGGLPSYFSYLRSHNNQRKHGRKLPTIYATYPILQLGPMTLYDYHSNVSLDGKNPGFTLDDVDTIFTTNPHADAIPGPTITTTTTDVSGIDATNATTTTTINSNNNNSTTAAAAAAAAATTTLTNGTKSSTTVLFQTVKYSQCIPLTADGAVTLTAHRSGHVIGGAYWILQRVADETTVVIAPTYNPAKELLLDASTLLQDGYGAPDALVTRPGGAGGKLRTLYSQPRRELLMQQAGISTTHGTGGGSSSSNSSMPLLSIPPARILHTNLMEQIMSVLRRDGHVLLPTDACGRVLELLLLLDTYWTKHRLSHTYKLIWVGPMTTNILNYVQAQLEWLSTNLGKQFDYSHRGHPFQLSSVDICTSVAQVKELEREGLPMVCVASGGNLDCGPARDLLLDWGQDAENAIFFTDSQVGTLRRGATTIATAASSSPNDDTTTKGTTTPSTSNQLRRSGSGMDTERIGSGGIPTTAATGGILPSSHFSTAAQLLDKWCDAKLSGTEMEDEISVDVLVPARCTLEGKDLLEFNRREEHERRRRAAEEERIALLKEVELARGRLRLGEEDLLRESYSKPLFMTFIDQEEAVGIGQDPSIAKFGIGESIGYSDSILVDDYGIAVNPDKFHDLVTGSDRNYSRQAGGTGRVGDDALWMRRAGGRIGSSGGNVGVSTNKPLTMHQQQQSRPSTAAEGTVNDLSAAAAVVTDDEAVDEVVLEVIDLSEGRGIIRGRNGRPPTKVYTQPRQMDVLAEVSYIPLEGRVSSRAARQSVRALQPRSLVVLGGGTPPNLPGYTIKARSQGETVDDGSVAAISDDEFQSHSPMENRFQYKKCLKGEAQLLAETVLDVTVSKQVFIPDNKETIELPIGHAAYSVRLIDTPYQVDAMEIEENDKEDADEEHLEKDEVSMLGMDEVKVGQYTVRFVDCVATGQTVAADGSLVLAPLATSRGKGRKAKSGHGISGRPHILLSDGEVLLTDLRSTMIAQGLKAEYSTHKGYQQLLVNGRVVVMKDQTSGKIHVEGPLCQDYFTVRSIVCAQYVTL